MGARAPSLLVSGVILAFKSVSALDVRGKVGSEQTMHEDNHTRAIHPPLTFPSKEKKTRCQRQISDTASPEVKPL